MELMIANAHWLKWNSALRENFGHWLLSRNCRFVRFSPHYCSLDGVVAEIAWSELLRRKFVGWLDPLGHNGLLQTVNIIIRLEELSGHLRAKSGLCELFGLIKPHCPRPLELEQPSRSSTDNLWRLRSMAQVESRLAHASYLNHSWALPGETRWNVSACSCRPLRGEAFSTLGPEWLPLPLVGTLRRVIRAHSIDHASKIKQLLIELQHLLWFQFEKFRGPILIQWRHRRAILETLHNILLCPLCLAPMLLKGDIIIQGWFNMVSHIDIWQGHVNWESYVLILSH